jgi:hypothetical protein
MAKSSPSVGDSMRTPSFQSTEARLPSTRLAPLHWQRGIGTDRLPSYPATIVLHQHLIHAVITVAVQSTWMHPANRFFHALTDFAPTAIKIHVASLDVAQALMLTS